VYQALAEPACLEAIQPLPVPEVQNGEDFSEQPGCRETGAEKSVSS